MSFFAIGREELQDHISIEFVIDIKVSFSKSDLFLRFVTGRKLVPSLTIEASAGALLVDASQLPGPGTTRSCILQQRECLNGPLGPSSCCLLKLVPNLANGNERTFERSIRPGHR